MVKMKDKILEQLIGKRIKLTSMPNDPNPMPIGSEGVIEMIGSEFQGSTQIFVKWDNGRNLILLSDVDSFTVLPFEVRDPFEEEVIYEGDES